MARTLLVDADDIRRIVRRMGLTIVDEALRSGAASPDRLALVGVRRGGVPIAEMLKATIEAEADGEIPLGTVDIALYRDDAATAGPDPKIGPSKVDFDVAGRERGPRRRRPADRSHHPRRHRVSARLRASAPHLARGALRPRGGAKLPMAPDFVGRTIELEAGTKLDLEVDDAEVPVGAYVDPGEEGGP